MLIDLIKNVWRGRSQINDYDAGTRALAAGDLARASRCFEQAVRRKPSDPDAAFHAGIARYRLGAFGEALAHFERCIALVPSSADAYCHAAAAQQALGDAETARRYCARALELDPAHAETYGVLARIALPGPRYTRLLPALHQKLAPRTYVEIGVAEGASLRAILPATRVVGIDPAPRLAAPPAPSVQIHAMESDEYFRTRDLRQDLGGLPVDLAFIDGSHLFEQTMRDFINVERCATPASTILLHDTYPLDRKTAERTQHSPFWSGDVWRIVLILKKYRPELTVANVATMPTGLCIVRGLDPESRVLADRHDEIVEEFSRVDYSVLDADKATLLNLFPNDLERVLDLVTPQQSSPTPA